MRREAYPEADSMPMEVARQSGQRDGGKIGEDAGRAGETEAAASQ